jgi:hypothetical protein
VFGRAGTAVLVAALVLAAGARAQPTSQQVVLPGPVPYPTVSPPLAAYGPVPPNPTRYVFHITSTQFVRVGIDGQGRPTSVGVRQRLGLAGRGDYQFIISAPISDVRPAPGTDSQPGLRVNQVLWAGFSPGRKVLAADVKLRPRPVAEFLPLRLELERESAGATLSVVNATRTPVLEYSGLVRPEESAKLLDETRRAARAGVRVSPAQATFFGPVTEVTPHPQVEAPIKVAGQLSFPGSRPVAFAATLGDGRPFGITVHARGTGRPHVRLRAWPVPPERLLTPPGAPTWKAAVGRRPIPAASLLKRLLQARMRMVRVDQYQTFLSNPDADGRNRIVYEYETAAAPRRAAPAPKEGSGGSGSGPLVLVLALLGSILAVGAALAAWAHS